MARRPNTPVIQARVFSSLGEVDSAITKFKRRLAEVEALDPSRIRFDGPERDNAESNISPTVLEVFGPNSPEYQQFQYYRIWSGAQYVDMPPEYCQACFTEGIDMTKSRLQGIIGRLEERRLDFQESAPLAPCAAPALPRRIFIGHGGSLTWLDLKELLVDRLGQLHEEFNRETPAGLSHKERLLQMLESSSLAFLVMTAEDEHADGTRHSRENVIHEAGLFQGRYGFTRAIVMLEEGCTEFSNIHGIGQLRFPRGNILACSEEVRRVLEREGFLPRESGTER